MLDKKIDSRESYFRSLAKQVVALEDAINKINNAWTSIENSKNDTQKSEQPPDSTITRLRSLQSLRNAVFKLKVFEDFLQQVNPELKAISRNLHNVELAKKDPVKVKRKGVKMDRVRDELKKARGTV